MPNTNPTPNMNLPVPVVGVDPGPDYANNVDSCFTILDMHNHSAGLGVAINPNGLNINADLPFGSNNATALRSVRFTAQGSPISGAQDLGCAYVAGVDLYFNDENGNQIQITKNGGLAGTNGSIANLIPPASASYVSGTGTFVFQSGANIPGNLDGASLIIRDETLNSFGITINAPAGLAADYSVTFPGTLPASEKFMTLDNLGNIQAHWAVDNSTIVVASNVVKVPTSGITSNELASNAVITSKILDANVTRPKLSSLGQQISGSSGTSNNQTSSTTYIDLSNIITLSITTTGRPIYFFVNSDGNTSNPASLIITGPSTAGGAIRLFRTTDSFEVGSQSINLAVGSTNLSIPSSSLIFFDTPGAGTWSYNLQFKVFGGAPVAIGLFNSVLVAYEL